MQRGELRFGERLPNPFAEGTEMTLWFHPRCAAYKRAEAVLEALPALEDAAEREILAALALAAVQRPRAARLDGAERARGVAMCRQCREPIARGSWRIRLSMFEEGAVNPLGFVHLMCAAAYCEEREIADRVLHFTPELTAAEREELLAGLAQEPSAPSAP